MLFFSYSVLSASGSGPHPLVSLLTNSFFGAVSRPGIVTMLCLQPYSTSSGLDVSVGIIGNSHGWRSTYLFHKKNKELSGLGLAAVATVEVYVSGRFVEHF